MLVGSQILRADPVYRILGSLLRTCMVGTISLVHSRKPQFFC